MSNVYRGLNLHWGTAITSSALGDFISKGASHVKTGDITNVKNGLGRTVARAFVDEHEEGTLEILTAKVGTPTGNETVDAPAFGDRITVAGAPGSTMSGSNFHVDKVTISYSEEAAKLSIEVSQWPEITN